MAVYFYGCVSLDGHLATSDHDLDWLYETGTTEETGYDDFYACMDVTLMGRHTFAELMYALVPVAVPIRHHVRQNRASNRQKLTRVMPTCVR